MVYYPMKKGRPVAMFSHLGDLVNDGVRLELHPEGTTAYIAALEARVVALEGALREITDTHGSDISDVGMWEWLNDNIQRFRALLSCRPAPSDTEAKEGDEDADQT